MSPKSPVPSGEPALGRTPRPARGSALFALLLLFVLPLSLRLVPVGHGMPRNYVHDTHVVRNALGMLRDRNPVPPAGQYSIYPNLVPYLLVPAYAAYFAFGSATGRWSSAGEFGEALTADASPAHLIARLLVALFGALTPWVVFRLAREVGLSAGAWVAAVLVATSVLHVHFSVQERPWVPMVFFFALSALYAARHVGRGDRRSLVLSGVAGGLAFACLQAGILAAALPALAWLAGPAGWGRRELGARAGAALLCAAAFTATALVLGHPYLLVHGPTAREAVVGGDLTAFSVGAIGVRFGFRLESAGRLGLSFLAHDPVLVLLGLAGLWSALRRRSARPALVFLVGWLLFFGFHESEKIRYLLPGAVLLALPAGFAAESIARTPRGVLVLAGLLVLPLAMGSRLALVLSRADTRALAEARLSELLPPGARLAIDRYGPAFDLDRRSLERLAELRARTGSQLEIRERARLERYREGREPRGGLDGLFLQELLDFVERDTHFQARGLHTRPGLESLGASPAEVLAGEGFTHLLLVDRRAFGGGPNLLRELVGERQPILAIEPWSGIALPREATLPMELERPWTALWAVSRPGPALELYELGPASGAQR